MYLTLFIIGVSLFCSAYWLVAKPKTNYFARKMAQIHFIFLLLSVLIVILFFNGFRFVGNYTSSFIGLVCLTSGIMLFGLATSRMLKLYSGLIAIPTLVTEISFFAGFASAVFLPAILIFIIFRPVGKKEKINRIYSLEIIEGSPFAPLNIFQLTKRTAVIFEKQISLSTSFSYQSKILKTEVLEFNEGRNVICKFYPEDSKKAIFIDTLTYFDRP